MAFFIFEPVSQNCCQKKPGMLKGQLPKTLAWHWLSSSWFFWNVSHFVRHITSVRQKKRPPSLEALNSGALGEIRTPYPLVRRQVREIQFILCSSTGYKAYPVSRFEQHPVCNPLKCQVSLLSSETAFQVAYAEVEPWKIASSTLPEIRSLMSKNYTQSLVAFSDA